MYFQLIAVTVLMMAFAVIAVPITKPATRSINESGSAEASATLMQHLAEGSPQNATLATSPHNIVPCFDNIVVARNGTKNAMDIKDCDYDKEYERATPSEKGANVELYKMEGKSRSWVQAFVDAVAALPNTSGIGSRHPNPAVGGNVRRRVALVRMEWEVLHVLYGFGDFSRAECVRGLGQFLRLRRLDLVATLGCTGVVAISGRM
ncbi:hypothetical protein K491DRAFT_679488 [Lophiostoma macrostomum CBS 122681]|uniref:Uncharacterized protein n=1 Tax=Lophiostoma macrostomum CBS 122681 TaxID=1314788 RepID=A0A6A6T7Y3_9PLEO|nr:hypothetical protein K491DRAFT_679488 [Lophiostoma macrostomum CBS 122681]